jgi:hypothetical protein
LCSAKIAPTKPETATLRRGRRFVRFFVLETERKRSGGASLIVLGWNDVVVATKAARYNKSDRHAVPQQARREDVEGSRRETLANNYSARSADLVLLLVLLDLGNVTRLRDVFVGVGSSMMVSIVRTLDIKSYSLARSEHWGTWCYRASLTSVASGSQSQSVPAR